MGLGVFQGRVERVSSTERLIQELARDVTPVRPLRRPTLRAAAWVAGAAVYLGVLFAVMSPRDDLGARIYDIQFLVEQWAALLMGITAAAAALASVVPGRRLRALLMLPLGSLAVWLWLIGVRALQDAETVGLGAADSASHRRARWIGGSRVGELRCLPVSSLMASI